MAAPVPHLSQTPIDIQALRDNSRRELLDCLDAAGSPAQAVVLDETLVGALGLIAEYSLLKEHGVEKLFQLEDRLETELATVTYFLRPEIEAVKKLVSHVRAAQEKHYFVYFVPRQTLVVEEYLKQEGVFGNLVIGDYNLDIVPIDYDLLSLEQPFAYRDCALNGDETVLYYAARSLMKLQSLFGVIPRVYGKGKAAQHVADMMQRMLKERVAGDEDEEPQIDSLILLDREVDKVTPLCTQLTYEGLIDEIFGINNGYASVPPSILAGDKNKPAPSGARKTKIALNSGDTVYEEIRDLNFARVGPLLNKRAKKISEEYDERHGAKTVGQIKDFIAKLSGIQAEHQALRIHTNIAERIMEATRRPEFLTMLEHEQMFISGIDTDKFSEYIEDCICRQEPLLKVLRLVCLQSLCNGGLKQRVLDQYRTEILQTYGFEHVETLRNLQQVGLLATRTDKFRFDVARKQLRLVKDDVDEFNPTDIAYVFSGYAPISVRLVENVSLQGWRGLDYVLRDLPGPQFDFVQVQRGQKAPPAKMTIGTALKTEQKAKVTLVYFLGGCSFAEIAAIRFLAERSEGQREFLIATTNIVNGDSLLMSLMDEIPVANPLHPAARDRKRSHTLPSPD